MTMNNIFNSPLYNTATNMWSAALENYKNQRHITPQEGVLLMNSWQNIATVFIPEMTQKYGNAIQQQNMQQEIVRYITSAVNQVRTQNNASMGGGMNTAINTGMGAMGGGMPMHQNIFSNNNQPNQIGGTYNTGGMINNTNNPSHFNANEPMGDNFGNTPNEVNFDPFNKPTTFSNQDEPEVIAVTQEHVPEGKNKDLFPVTFTDSYTVIQRPGQAGLPKGKKIFDNINQTLIKCDNFSVVDPDDNEARYGKFMSIDFRRSGQSVGKVLNKCINLNSDFFREADNWISLINFDHFMIFKSAALADVKDGDGDKMLNLSYFAKGFGVPLSDKVDFNEAFNQLIYYFDNLSHATTLLVEPVIVNLINMGIQRYIRLKNDISDCLEITEIRDLDEILTSTDESITKFTKHPDFREAFWMVMRSVFRPFRILDDNQKPIKASSVISDLMFDDEFQFQVEPFSKEAIYELEGEQRDLFMKEFDSQYSILKRNQTIVLMAFVIDGIRDLMADNECFELEPKAANVKTISVLEKILDTNHRSNALATIYMRDEHGDIIIKEGLTLNGTRFYYQANSFDE